MRALTLRGPMGADPAHDACTKPHVLVQGCRHPKEALLLTCTRTLYRLVMVLGASKGQKELVSSVGCSLSSKQVSLWPWPSHPNSSGMPEPEGCLHPPGLQT